MQVNINGAIFIGQGTDANYVSHHNSIPLGIERRKFATPFWADVVTTCAGDVWYQQSTSQALLDKANTYVNKASLSTDNSVLLHSN